MIMNQSTVTVSEVELLEGADVVGAGDRERLMRWTHTVVTTLAAARGQALPDGPDLDDQVAAAEWWARAAAILHADALPRLEALRDACVAAHEAAGGSYGDLAVALGRARDDRSLAQRLRERAADTTRAHHHWPTDPGRDTDKSKAGKPDAELRDLYASAIEILVEDQVVAPTPSTRDSLLTLTNVDRMAEWILKLYAGRRLQSSTMTDAGRVAIIEARREAMVHVAQMEQRKPKA